MPLEKSFIWIITTKNNNKFNNNNKMKLIVSLKNEQK